MASEKSDVEVTPADQKRPSPRLLTVEPVVLLVMAVQGALVALRTLYIEHRLAVSYNYTLPTDDVNATGCDNVTKDATQIRIESETAIWVAYMKGVSDFLPLFGALLYGAASDFIGRKPIMLVSISGHVLGTALFACVAYFGLPLFSLVVCEVILGLCGDSLVLECMAMAYVTDIYAGKQLSFRLFVLDVIGYVGFGGSQILATTLLQVTHSNYAIVYVACFAIACLCFLYVTIPRVLPETVPRRPFSRGVLRDLATQIYRLYKNNSNGRRWRLILLTANMMVYELIYEAVFSVIIIYGLGPPFCWDDNLVGLYGVICNIAPALASLLAMKVLGFCISEYSMIYIGFLSGIGLMLTTSLAETTPILAYVAPAVGLLRVLPTSLLMFLASRLVDHSEEGSLFGALGVWRSVGRFLSPVLTNGIYSATVKLGYPTLTFYVSAGVLAVPLFINGFLHATQPRHGYQPVNSSSDEEDTKPLA